ncbi:MAG: HEPN domain-containing protein [Planctomycetes bacterium]|nr:HEPN domain-containing protein [Planctomycetota bacterium]
MDPDIFIETAKLLLRSGTNEADFRSVISRAYYACFLYLREIAFSSCRTKAMNAAGIYKSSDIGHKSLAAFFSNAPENSLSQLARDLKDLQKTRNLADYELKRSGFNKKLASDVLDDAVAFLESLRKLDREKFGAAMESYIRNVYKT